MGVARDVLTAPGDETVGIDIHMDIPLDREQQVELTRLPAGKPRGPHPGLPAQRFHLEP